MWERTGPELQRITSVSGLISHHLVNIAYFGANEAPVVATLSLLYLQANARGMDFPLAAAKRTATESMA